MFGIDRNVRIGLLPNVMTGHQPPHPHNLNSATKISKTSKINNPTSEIMTSLVSIFLTEESIHTDSGNYGGTYDDKVDTHQDGSTTVTVCGQRKGRGDIIVEDGIANGALFAIYNRKKTNLPFTLVGFTRNSYMFTHRVGAVGEDAEVLMQVRFVIYPEDMVNSVCTRNLPGDSTPGCIKRAAMASIGIDNTTCFPQNFMYCFFKHDE